MRAGRWFFFVSSFAAMPAHAEHWFRWVDAAGYAQLSRERPGGGVLFEDFQVPDPVAWSHPPERPEARAADEAVDAGEVFRVAAESVYWVLNGQGARPRESTTQLYGSAVAISEDLALTNCHVMQGAGRDAILGAGEGETSRVEIVASNVVADRCVIRSRDLKLKPVAGVRATESLAIGEPVYAIGNPRKLERTLSDGILSGKRLMSAFPMLQTTAAISPGSSGGGLFDAHGNLVGITTSSLRGAQHINFAIPAAEFWK